MPEKPHSRWNFAKVIPSVPSLRFPGRSALTTGSSSTSLSPSSSSSLLKSKSLPDHPPRSSPKELPSLPPLGHTKSIERKPIGASRSPPAPALPVLKPNPLPTPTKDARKNELGDLALVTPKQQSDRLQLPLPPLHLRQDTLSIDSISSLLSAYTRDFDDAPAVISSLETTPASLHGSQEELKERIMTDNGGSGSSRTGSGRGGSSSSRSSSSKDRNRRSDKSPPPIHDGSDATAIATGAGADATNGSGSRSSHPGPSPGTGAGIITPPTSTRTTRTSSTADTPQPQHKSTTSTTSTRISTISPAHHQQQSRQQRANLLPPLLPPSIVKDDARQPRAPPSTTLITAASVEHAREQSSRGFAHFATTQPPKLNLPQPPIKRRESEAASAVPPGHPTGQTIRPAPAHDQATPSPPSSATQNMGSETSKLRQFKDKLGSSPRPRNESAAGVRNVLSKPPAALRPPTPEYRKEDLGNEPAAVDVFISPVSPASSPGATRSVSLESFEDLYQAKAASDELKNDAPAVAQSTRGKELPSIPARDHQFPIRTTSTQKTPSPPQGLAPRPNAQPPSAPQPESHNNPAYRGRDGTLYSEMKLSQEANPDAASFPEQQFHTPASDGIWKAAPLSNAHLTCYQRHRTMHRRGNRRYPLTCQTCDKPDMEDRWACTFCNLQVCEFCFRKLGAYRRDLNRLVDELANKAHSGYAPPPSRSGGDRIGL